MTATDVAGWSEKTANWDYDIAFCYLYQYGDAALGVSRNYLTSTIAKGSPWNNVEGYSNPKVDELFERGAQEADPQKRRALYEEVQRILVDEAPVAWLLELQFPTLYRNNIKNLINSGIGLNDSWRAPRWPERRAARQQGNAMKKLAYLMCRVAQGLLVLALIAVINFLLIRAAPGDPAAVMAGEAGAADEAFRARCASASDWTSCAPAAGDLPGTRPAGPG